MELQVYVEQAADAQVAVQVSTLLTCRDSMSPHCSGAGLQTSHSSPRCHF